MKWQLNNQEYKVFANCKHGEYLKCSNNFILCLNDNKSITWSLLCFPNGHDFKYKNFITFQLFTKPCDTIPLSTNPLVVELTIIFEQISFKQSFTLQFHQKQLYQYIPTKIPFKESNNFSQLIFHWNIQSNNEIEGKYNYEYKHTPKEPEEKEIKKHKNNNNQIDKSHKTINKTLKLDISPNASSSKIDTKTVWQIDPSFIPLLINKIDYTLWGNTFCTDKGIKFQLQIKNSLKNTKLRDSISIVLHLLQLPQNIKIITCNFSIFCIECNTKNYGSYDMSIHDLNGCKNEISLLYKHALEVYELKNTKTLNIIVEIEIPEVVWFSNAINNNIKQAIYSKEINYEINNYEWKINENQLLKFKTARNGKVFCGPKWGIWYLKASPNGFEIDNKGCVQLDICNLYMPSEYYKIISYITLRCRELNISFNDTIEFTSWNTKYYSWPRNTLKTNQIQSLSQITFQFDMKIIKIVKRIENNNNKENHSNNYSQHNH